MHMPAFQEGTKDCRMMSMPASRMANPFATDSLNSFDRKIDLHVTKWTVIYYAY